VQNKRIAMHDNRNTLQDYGHKKTSASIADAKIPINKKAADPHPLLFF
jgi:hypothetical protein